MTIAFVRMAGLAVPAALVLSACGGGGGVFNRDAPDEFAISRAAPLVVPPDYNLTPPKPGAPRPLSADSQNQAMEALFGPGVRVPPKSPSEQQLLDKAGADKSDPTVRSTVGDTSTNVVNKGVMVKQIIDAPAGSTDAQVAQVTVGG